jgi:hypothetical protein
MDNFLKPNRLQVKACGTLKTDSPFKAIFPSGVVPLTSLNTVVPGKGAPDCYVIRKMGLKPRPFRTAPNTLVKSVKSVVM